MPSVNYGTAGLAVSTSTNFNSNINNTGNTEGYAASTNFDTGAGFVYTVGIPGSTGSTGSSGPAPTTQITRPAVNGPQNASLTVVSGTAAQGNGGPALFGVQARVYDANTSQYWDNATHAFDSLTASMAWFKVSSVTGSGWTQWIMPFTFVDQTTYTVEAQAFDTGGHFDNVTSTRTFLYDTDAPTSLVSFPANGAFLNSLPVISGTSLIPMVGLGPG